MNEWIKNFANSDLARFLSDSQLMRLTPEIIIMLVIVVCTLWLAFAKSKEEHQATWRMATTGTVLALAVLLFHGYRFYFQDGEWVSQSVWFGLFQADLFSLIIRLLLLLGTVLTLLISRQYINRQSAIPGEYYVILLSGLLGGMFLSGATDLIMIFVSLETLSISSYILVAYLRGNMLSAEAGLKYLLYGGMATAILLFGFSLLYGLTGTTQFYPSPNSLGLASLLTPELIQTYPLVIAIMTVMILGGVAFKLSVAPFHMWAPDVYEGAPTPVTAFLSVVSKIAGFALAIRFFTALMGELQGWFLLLAVMAVLSMVIGNVVALTQTNIKRLLAYSTVAHAGYLMMGLVVLTPMGLASLLYYLVAYLFMNMGAFAVVIHFGNLTGRDDIASYAGLVRARPTLALIFSIMLLSLAGIPITAGFFGKFFLFQAVAQASDQYLWLVVVALLTSTVSLYYYLNIIRLMVIAEPSEAVEGLMKEAPKADVELTPAFSAVLLFCLAGTLVLGLWAHPFMNIARDSINALDDPMTASHALPVVSRAR